MKITPLNIKIKDLIKGYENNEYDGVVAYNKKLDIRPPYQRNFVYDDDQRDAVIDSVMKGLPLNIIYWADREDGTYEVIDGQQRTISICEYAEGNFGVNFGSRIDNESLGISNLSKEMREKFFEYPLLVYVCSGTDDEKLDWFKTINIAGEELYPQELRNAVYHGTWLSDAKKWFSRMNCPAQAIGSPYIRAKVNRQEYLQTALEWISYSQGISIEEYMRIHQHDKNADELWNYYEMVIDWIQDVFIKKRKEMLGLPWGKFYLQYKDDKFNPEEIEKRISELYKDVELKNKKGIYEYILTGDSKYLNLRTFEDHVKKAIYEKQKNKCAHCKKEFPFNQMHADHIKPWSLGGKTEPENCQVLCQSCNAKKSDNY
ncbi:MAG: DUF262 domain-containing protein [Tissierellia bacterium]|nr:DUF262 domain-containing protein [Tissierellia bacterium]